MEMRDLFLAQHSAMHTVAVGGNKASAAERVLNGLTEDQMRLRPREDLNSIAWILWHVARAEDIILNPVLTGRDQLFDDAWMKRLGVTRKDFGVGMKSPEVTDLTRSINLDALREYRDAVGKRTRELIGGFQPQDWEGQVQQSAMERAAAEGAVPPPMVQAFSGRPRAAVLSGIALFHPAGHFGEATTIRSAGGFGTGI
jgi:DinB superfamily